MGVEEKKEEKKKEQIKGKGKEERSWWLLSGEGEGEEGEDGEK
ncbi:MAG: hypothetical protein Q8807_03520 ['Waltheria sp.' little leaf phytoplasma]|nr:hypothetical protein ['Waltheria sp.' little leaf phytoplasma]